MKRIVILIAAIAAFIPAGAQQTIGKVVDPNKEAVEFVNVIARVQADSTIVTGTITAEDGTFIIDTKGRKADVLEFSLIGYKTMTIPFQSGDLGEIVIEEDAEALKAAGVVALRDLVKMEVDKISYDVSADAESQTLTTLQMLKKVPYITVDAEGNISLKGGSNYRIYKNGRPSNSYTKNAKTIFEGIPASMIEKIEVITEPGAKYDAEGVDGIINIVMKEGVVSKGVMANVFTQYTYRQKAGGAYVNAQVGKFDLGMNLALVRLSDKGNTNMTESSYDYKDSGLSNASSSEMANPGWAPVVSLEASYQISDRDLLNLTLDGMAYNVDIYGNSFEEQKFTASGMPVYSFKDALENSNQKYFDFSGKIDYQHKGKKNPENTFTLSYLLSTSDTHYQVGEHYYDCFQMPVSYTRHFADNEGLLVEHTFQADFEHPFNANHRVDFGAKYILRNNGSYVEQSYDNVFIPASDFSHITDVGALYGEYRYTNGRWSAKAGLRYEYSFLSAKFRDGSNPDFSSHLNDFVPFAGINFTIDQSSSLKFNYASRVERPGITYLNPARMETFVEVSEGNPNLKSSRPNNLSLTYSLMKQKFMMTLSASMKMNNDGISELSWEKDGIRYSTYDNIARFRQQSLEAYIRWQVFTPTTFSLVGSVSNTSYSNASLGITNKGVGAYLRPSITQMLPAGFMLIADGAWYNSPVNDLYSKNGGYGFYQLSVQRNFGKEGRLSCRISAANFLSDKYLNFKTERVNGGYTGASNTKIIMRSVGVMVSYRFGNISSAVKKVARTIDNDDLVGQKSQGKSVE